MDVTLTPRQSGDRLLIKMRNNGLGGKFAAEVITIIYKENGGSPINQPDWPVPWVSDGKRDISTAAVHISKGQSRTLDFARYDPAAVQASRAGEADEPHWWFPTLPEPMGITYWPPIKSGKDLSARRFVALIRVYRSEPAHYTDFTFEVGVTGSLLICNPVPLKCTVLQAVWKPWREKYFIVSARIEIVNRSAKAVRLGSTFRLESDSGDGSALEPDGVTALKRAVTIERQKYSYIPADCELPAHHYMRGWYTYSLPRSRNGGKPHCTLICRDVEGRLYPMPIEPLPPSTHS
jgi:hypothetical protein